MQIHSSETQTLGFSNSFSREILQSNQQNLENMDFYYNEKSWGGLFLNDIVYYYKTLGIVCWIVIHDTEGTLWSGIQTRNNGLPKRVRTYQVQGVQRRGGRKQEGNSEMEAISRHSTHSGLWDFASLIHLAWKPLQECLYVLRVLTAHVSSCFSPPSPFTSQWRHCCLLLLQTRLDGPSLLTGHTLLHSIIFIIILNGFC